MARRIGQGVSSVLDRSGEGLFGRAAENPRPVLGRQRGAKLARGIGQGVAAIPHVARTVEHDQGVASLTSSITMEVLVTGFSYH